MVKCQQTE